MNFANIMLEEWSYTNKKKYIPYDIIFTNYKSMLLEIRIVISLRGSSD